MTIGKNIVSLGLVQVANYLIPIIIIPIVARILGQELFGQVSYAQNIVTYLTLLVNYGFEYSATRQIALCHADSEEGKEKMRRIFWSVIEIKSVLLLVSFAILGVLGICMDKVVADPRLYWYTALTNIGIVLFPTWFFQGIQQMTKMAWMNFAIKLLGAVMVVALMHQASQYRLYPLMLSISSIVVGGLACLYVVKKHQLGWGSWSIADIKETGKAGWSIFLNNVFVALYTTANMTILGLYVSDSELGAFAGAQRLIIALNMCVVMPVSVAIFPEMSRRYENNPTDGEKFFGQVLWKSVGVALCISLLTWIVSPLAVRIMLGESFADSIPLLREMAIVSTLIMAATILTVQGLYGRGLQRYAPWVGLSLGILCIGLNLLLIPRIGAEGAIISWIGAEAAEIIIVGSILLYQKTRRKCSI